MPRHDKKSIITWPERVEEARATKVLWAPEKNGAVRDRGRPVSSSGRVVGGGGGGGGGGWGGGGGGVGGGGGGLGGGGGGGGGLPGRGRGKKERTRLVSREFWGSPPRTAFAEGCGSYTGSLPEKKIHLKKPPRRGSYQKRPRELGSSFSKGENRICELMALN